MLHNYNPLALFVFLTASVHVNAVPTPLDPGPFFNSAILYASSYAGQIQSLKLSQSNGAYSLNTLDYYYGCAPNASWLTVDYSKKVMYCVNEALNGGNGSLLSYGLGSAGSGKLTEKGKLKIMGGAVHSGLFDHDNALAVAH